MIDLIIFHVVGALAALAIVIGIFAMTGADD